MKLTIKHPLAIKAAGNIANGGYTCSFLGIKNDNGTARISGTNGYVSLSAKVNGEFYRWPKDRSIWLNKDSVRALMRAVGKNLNKTSVVVLEYIADRNDLKVSCEIEGAIVETTIPLENTISSLDKFDWDGGREYENIEGTKVSSYFLQLASQSMLTLGMKTFDLLGNKNRAFKLTAEADNISAVALVMPKS